MKLVGVAGIVEQLDEFIETCCMDGNFHPEPAAQYLPVDLGYTPMEDVNPYADMLQKVEEFAHNARFEIAPVRHLKHTPTDDEIRAFVDQLNRDAGRAAAGRKDLIEQHQACERGIEQLKHFTNSTWIWTKSLTVSILKCASATCLRITMKSCSICRRIIPTSFCPLFSGRF